MTVNIPDMHPAHDQKEDTSMPYRPYEETATANLQRYLRQLSYFNEDIPRPPVDGIFEAATEAAIRAYQESVGLPVTGLADKKTWDILYLDYLASLDENSPPAPLYIFPRHPQEYSIGLGDEGFIVLTVQYLLRELLTSYGYDDGLMTQSGTYDTETEDAVRKFQQLYHLTESGRVDHVTWNNLTAAYQPIVERFPRE